MKKTNKRGVGDAENDHADAEKDCAGTCIPYDIIFELQLHGGKNTVSTMQHSITEIQCRKPRTFKVVLLYMLLHHSTRLLLCTKLTRRV